MKKASLKQEFISPDDILDRTNGGYDIFKFYLGNVSRLMSRPWGKPERKLSWGVFPYNGIWFYRDMANEESGSAIQFVEKYFNLTFKEALDKISSDFGLVKGTSNIVANVTWKAPIIEKEYAHISFSSQPFTKKHHEFWNCVSVNEAHCNKYNCWAVKDAAINRKRVVIGKDEIVFAYYSPIDDRVKLYFPEREEDRWKNNVPFHHLWNYENVEKCETLIIQKSVKDLIVTTLFIPCVIATQAEAVKIFNEEIVEKINNISHSPVVWYGSDWDGVKKCKQITDTNGWKYVNTPKNLLPDVNDTYSYAKRFGIEKLGEFMKIKNLI